MRAQARTVNVGLKFRLIVVVGAPRSGTTRLSRSSCASADSWSARVVDVYGMRGLGLCFASRSGTPRFTTTSSGRAGRMSGLAHLITRDRLRDDVRRDSRRLALAPSSGEQLVAMKEFAHDISAITELSNDARLLHIIRAGCDVVVSSRAADWS